jgi:Tfp pilus assembly protein PilX
MTFQEQPKGIALITVVIVMLTMALIGTALAELSSAVNYSAEEILEETKARYLAEAGIAHALHELRLGKDLSDTVNPANGEPVYFPLGEGGYTVVFNSAENLITCSGIVNKTKKTMQLQYNVF